MVYEIKVFIFYNLIKLYSLYNPLDLISHILTGLGNFHSFFISLQF